MNLFDKFKPVLAAHQSIVEHGADPFSLTVERVLSPTEAIINGRRTILAGTNNYLGLTFDPQCIESAREALVTQGTGTTGSRMANGSFQGHVALERELADFYGCAGAIVFSTGYQANLGLLSTLAGPEDVILLDADSHASIYDGCRLGGAEVIRFRHNDVNDLEKRLKRLGERASMTVIVIEGVYSMLGDRAPLAAITAIKEQYGACLVVDEAHSLGVLGARGRGLAEEANLEEKVDFIVGTFSKSLGSTGGFCVSRRPELDLIRYTSRPYIFSASLCPSVVASTRRALKILEENVSLRERLWKNSHTLYAGLQKIGFTLGPEVSPVIAATVPSKEYAIAFWNGLVEQGVYVNLMLPPATPNGVSLLRCSVSAAHSEEQLAYICDVFGLLRAKYAESDTP
ncbi:MAG: aminotransferase class I/II-fold pyridoxal phosphate-dependent enzyme [Nitrospirales bacterium]|nr:aminotransferase class I/II-fold pyridoxal phosphate-dependent enzyme [Nitrospira sp.]MDR4503146.1 aminotransferase class I/II-fold pyridoxal phosphate-dependent enzyme [Nitrospirales bacterium]